MLVDPRLGRRMKLAIQINGHPGSSHAAATAYQFIKAAVAKNHEIILVFFYYDGIFAGLVSPGASTDQDSGSLNWTELAASQRLDLVLCVSAAERRGLPTPSSGQMDHQPPSFPAMGFRLGGLGLWVDACLRCDRFITFAA